MVAGLHFMSTRSQSNLIMRDWVCASFQARLLYWSKDNPSIYSAFLMECTTRCLLWMFASMSKRRIGLRLCGKWFLVSLWMSISRTWWYILGEYPVNQIKLNRRRSISLSSGLRASIFTMAGVVVEVLEEIASLRLMNSSVYSCWEMGVDGDGSIPLIALIYFRKLLVWSCRDGRFGDVPSRCWSPKEVFPLFFRGLISVAYIGGFFLKTFSLLESLSVIYF